MPSQPQATTTATTGYALSVAGIRVNAAPAQPFTNALATISDSDPQAAPAGFSADIDWGDNSPHATETVANGGITVSPGNEFTVIGGHTYSQPGSYNVTVVVSDNDDNKEVRRAVCLLSPQPRR